MQWQCLRDLSLIQVVEEMLSAKIRASSNHSLLQICKHQNLCWLGGQDLSNSPKQCCRQETDSTSEEVMEVREFVHWYGNCHHRYRVLLRRILTTYLSLLRWKLPYNCPRTNILCSVSSYKWHDIIINGYNYSLPVLGSEVHNFIPKSSQNAQN